MIDEGALDPHGLASRVLPVVSGQPGAAPSFRRRQLRRHDQVHRYRIALCVEAFDRLPPTAGLFRALESCLGHDFFQRRLGGKLVGVDDEIGVGGVRLVGGQQAGGSQIDGLSAHEDDGVVVRFECCERIEENPSGVYVFDAMRLFYVHGMSARMVREGACQRGALFRIHSSRASPSEGNLPGPVRQSTATWARDAFTGSPRRQVRSNTMRL